jgi:hypothetical protein
MRSHSILFQYQARLDRQECLNHRKLIGQHGIMQRSKARKVLFGEVKLQRPQQVDALPSGSWTCGFFDYQRHSSISIRLQARLAGNMDTKIGNVVGTAIQHRATPALRAAIPGQWLTVRTASTSLIVPAVWQSVKAAAFADFAAWIAAGVDAKVVSIACGPGSGIPGMPFPMMLRSSVTQSSKECRYGAEHCCFWALQDCSRWNSCQSCGSTGTPKW